MKRWDKKKGCGCCRLPPPPNHCHYAPSRLLLRTFSRLGWMEILCRQGAVYTMRADQLLHLRCCHGWYPHIHVYVRDGERDHHIFSKGSRPIRSAKTRPYTPLKEKRPCPVSLITRRSRLWWYLILCYLVPCSLLAGGPCLTEPV